MLTSVKNPRIQRIRKLQNSARTRQKEQVFVVEGVRLLEETLQTGWQPELVLYTPETSERGLALAQAFQQQGVETIQAAPHAFNAASDTQNAQGILAVIPFQNAALPAQPTLILLLDEIRDPGNLGTILRTALAAGVDGVLIPPGTVDPFSPKVMRAGMGAHFKLPIIAMDWQAIQNWSTAHQLQFYLADSNGGQSIYQSKFKKPCGIIIGGEAAGAGAQARQLAHQAITIPMPGPAESLNAGVAAAIILFEFVRQNIEK